MGNVGTVVIDDENYEGGKREAVVMRVIEQDGRDGSLVLLDNGSKRWVPTGDIKRY